MIPTFSVCICTRNRADLLAGALASLTRQTLPAAQFEVLVIDNASTDETLRIAGEFAGSGLNLRAVTEPVIGLSAARNRGAAEAAGEWLAYLDDDALAPPDWLENAVALVREGSPDLFGGPFIPFYTTPKPSWYQDAYGTGTFGAQERLLLPHEFLFGGNLFIRREMLLAAGGFPLHLGPHGARLFYGDETGLQRALRQADPDLRVVYAPRLAIRHWVAPFKMTLGGRLKQRWVEGRSGYLAFREPGDRLRPAHLLGMAALPVVLGWHCSAGILVRDRRRYPAWQNYVFERAGHWAAVGGKLYQRLRTQIDEAGRDG